MIQRMLANPEMNVKRGIEDLLLSLFSIQEIVSKISLSSERFEYFNRLKYPFYFSSPQHRRRIVTSQGQKENKFRQKFQPYKNTRNICSFIGKVLVNQKNISFVIVSAYAEVGTT